MDLLKKFEMPDSEVQIIWAVVILLGLSLWLLPDKAGELMTVGVAGLFALARGNKEK